MINEESIKILKPKMRIKNWKALCEMFGEKYCKKSSDSGKAIQKKLSQYCEFYFDGQEVVILKIKDKIEPIKDNRRKKRNKNFCIPREYEHSSGIYIITNGNKSYIGSTTNFYNRYQQHMKTNPLMPNGKFELLELVDDTSLLHIKEQYYIDTYDNLINKYNVIPKKNKYKTIKVPEQLYDKVISYVNSLLPDEF